MKRLLSVRTVIVLACVVVAASLAAGAAPQASDQTAANPVGKWDGKYDVIKGKTGRPGSCNSCHVTGDVKADGDRYLLTLTIAHHPGKRAVVEKVAGVRDGDKIAFKDAKHNLVLGDGTLTGRRIGPQNLFHDGKITLKQAASQPASQPANHPAKR